MIGDENLTKGVYFADVVAMEQGSEIAKPVCEDENVEPQVYAVPVAFGSPDGVPLVGEAAIACRVVPPLVCPALSPRGS